MDIIKGTVNWGIIGCGDVCEVKSGPAFNKVSHSKLVAVMRRDPEKVRDYAMRHGVGKYYTEAEALINDPEVNAIYIATPPSSHEMYTALALSAKKPVYVEKPVSLDAASCLRMMEKEQQSNTAVSVAHYRRGLPLFREVKKLVTEGAIGTPRLILVNTLQPPSSKIIHHTADAWRVNPDISGGGLFHDLSPHQLDIFYWIFGQPEIVSIKTANQGNRYPAPDLTTMQAIYPGNIHLNGTWSFSVAPAASTDQCEIIGDMGRIRFSFFKVSQLELTTEDGTKILEFEYPVNIQQPHIDAVVKYFRGEQGNPCSLEEALTVMKILDEARH